MEIVSQSVAPSSNPTDLFSDVDTQSMPSYKGQKKEKVEKYNENVEHFVGAVGCCI